MYLEHTIQFRGKHHVALGLQFASHERFLAVELCATLLQQLDPRACSHGTYLAVGKLLECFVRKNDSNVGL